jgi:hypothetical protein
LSPGVVVVFGLVFMTKVKWCEMQTIFLILKLKKPTQHCQSFHNVTNHLLRSYDTLCTMYRHLCITRWLDFTKFRKRTIKIELHSVLEAYVSSHVLCRSVPHMVVCN